MEYLFQILLDYNIRMEINTYHSKCKIGIRKASTAACRLSQSLLYAIAISNYAVEISWTLIKLRPALQVL